MSASRGAGRGRIPPGSEHWRSVSDGSVASRTHGNHLNIQDGNPHAHPNPSQPNYPAIQLYNRDRYGRLSQPIFQANRRYVPPHSNFTRPQPPYPDQAQPFKVASHCNITPTSHPNQTSNASLQHDLTPPRQAFDASSHCNFTPTAYPKPAFNAGSPHSSTPTSHPDQAFNAGSQPSSVPPKQRLEISSNRTPIPTTLPRQTFSPDPRKNFTPTSYPKQPANTSPEHNSIPSLSRLQHLPWGIRQFNSIPPHPYTGHSSSGVAIANHSFFTLPIVHPPLSTASITPNMTSQQAHRARLNQLTMNKKSINEQRALIRSHIEEMEAHLEELKAINSHSANSDTVDPEQRNLRAALDKADVDMDELARLWDHYGVEDEDIMADMWVPKRRGW